MRMKFLPPLKIRRLYRLIGWLVDWNGKKTDFKKELLEYQEQWIFINFWYQANSLSWNRGVFMASQRGQILLAVFILMHVLPVRLATVSTQTLCFGLFFILWGMTWFLAQALQAELDNAQVTQEKVHQENEAAMQRMEELQLKLESAESDLDSMTFQHNLQKKALRQSFLSRLIRKTFWSEDVFVECKFLDNFRLDVICSASAEQIQHCVATWDQPAFSVLTSTPGMGQVSVSFSSSHPLELLGMISKRFHDVSSFSDRNSFYLLLFRPDFDFAQFLPLFDYVLIFMQSVFFFPHTKILFDGFWWVLMGFNGFWWGLVGSGGFWWGLVGFDEFQSVWVGSDAEWSGFLGVLQSSSSFAYSPSWIIYVHCVI